MCGQAVVLCEVTTEALAFQHLDHDVTQPRVALFRDAIVEAIAAEVGAQGSRTAFQGLKIALNYAGGALSGSGLRRRGGPMEGRPGGRSRGRGRVDCRQRVLPGYASDPLVHIPE